MPTAWPEPLLSCKWGHYLWCFSKCRTGSTSQGKLPLLWCISKAFVWINGFVLFFLSWVSGFLSSSLDCYTCMYTIIHSLAGKLDRYFIDTLQREMPLSTFEIRVVRDRDEEGVKRPLSWYPSDSPSELIMLCSGALYEVFVCAYFPYCWYQHLLAELLRF